MPKLTDPEATTQAVLLYGRNSTDDQAEAGTIQNQQEFLRHFAALYRLEVVGEFWDEGVSGTVALDRRPEGRRLLAAAGQHPGAAVLCYRLDRLGRSLRALLDAHDGLAGAGVTIRSATEPFDTSTPIGKFLFQLLASLAELERSTISERTALGRARVARAGKWTGGPVPLGYDLDGEGRLIPSARAVPRLGITEAELVRDVFGRVAEGSSAIAETQRLNGLGVPVGRRYPPGRRNPDGRLVEAVHGWETSRLSRMLRNPLYVGRDVLRTRNGPVERPVPALVDEATWRAAAEQLRRNRQLAKKNAVRRYLLRGLTTCRECGQAYVGATSTPKGVEFRYYRCGAQSSRGRAQGTRCAAKAVRADWLEDEVWSACAAFVRDPGEPLEEARAQLRVRLAAATDAGAERERLAAALREKETERERVLGLYRRGRISEAEADRELASTAAEAAALREQLAASEAQEALARTTDAGLARAADLLAGLRAEVDEIERTGDWARKRRIVELLVGRVEVRTAEENGRRVAVPRAYLLFRAPDRGSSANGSTLPTSK